MLIASIWHLWAFSVTDFKGSFPLLIYTDALKNCLLWKDIYNDFINSLNRARQLFLYDIQVLENDPECLTEYQSENSRIEHFTT
jgi:hypothetical protein